MPRTKGYTKTNISEDTITLRIEKSLLDELRQESDKTGNSVNNIANQIIKSHLKWHNHAQKAGIGHFSKAFVNKIMGALTEEQVIKITQEFCNHDLFDMTYMLRSENTLSAFMDVLISWLDASGFHYRSDRITDDDGSITTIVYIIQFDMGKNWSLYIMKVMQFALEYYDVKNAQCEMKNIL